MRYLGGDTEELLWGGGLFMKVTNTLKNETVVMMVQHGPCSETSQVPILNGCSAGSVNQIVSKNCVQEMLLYEV